MTTGWQDIEQQVKACMAEKVDGRHRPRGLPAPRGAARGFAPEGGHREDRRTAERRSEVRARHPSEAKAEITRVDFERRRPTHSRSRRAAVWRRRQRTPPPHETYTKVVLLTPSRTVLRAQLTPQYLQTYIQALQALVDSPNNSTIILPFDQNLTPLINVGSNGATTGPVATPPDTSPNVPSSTPTTTRRGTEPIGERPDFSSRREGRSAASPTSSSSSSISSATTRWDGRPTALLTPRLDELARAEYLRAGLQRADGVRAVACRSADRVAPPSAPGAAEPVCARRGSPTMARAYRAGYQTAATGKMHFAPVHADHGFETLRIP
ncbi:MAG: hypothetical protein R2695_19485 [Acidimicrobiales bacterium]